MLQNQVQYREQLLIEHADTAAAAHAPESGTV